MFKHYGVAIDAFSRSLVVYRNFLFCRKQSDIANLLACSDWRKSDKTRLQYSLVNCNYTLRVLQHLKNQRIGNILSLKYVMAITRRCGCAYCKIQTSTFLTEGPGSVRLYKLTKENNRIFMWEPNDGATHKNKIKSNAHTDKLSMPIWQGNHKRIWGT